ncbi:MAG: hypothetical protein A2015_11295 [Spirochaetes bacterium GWF1_31_7]|nr:MAG: hypothetical protein A2Y30_02530 [Spirochaetes bacterium GWE1_32_154]OHD46830.1 MAG: hypothetical protein A2Y29_09855 [Spirochaetes bacterium GWE2_31_10]OHD47783.1 MAG: hypothetical protein A2015_11295 [Spirochaetes bacterium GWF1_31_7]HBD95638.1 hypothetical protein [Spirochaetia bacterium]HBI37450.1 hypothetical protein [Spirochaetia bacterium]
MVDPTGLAVWLRARELASFPSKAGVHTFLLIIPDNPKEFNNESKFTLGAYNNAESDTLEKRKNDTTDLNWKKEDLKKSWRVPTPEGLSDTEFINKILDSYDQYENNSRNYEPFPSTEKNQGNCNNFTTGLLEGGGVNENFFNDKNPSGFNPGLGNPLPEMLGKENAGNSTSEKVMKEAGE